MSGRKAGRRRHLACTALSYGFKTALFFYSGDCSSHNITIVNLALHLLINAAMTLVILNSPAREEIDDAHCKGSWLDIGVSSIRNTFRLSKFKSWSWMVVVLSSVPIHLLFNSAIFRTSYRGADFHLTIVDEEFIKGGTYFPPGASLLFPGVLYTPQSERDRPCRSGYYGLPVNLSQYKYGNIILVVDKPGGWVRDDMWKLKDNESLFWNQYVPPEQPNHLFFDAQCTVQSTFLFAQFYNCINDCIGAFGARLGREWEDSDLSPTCNWKPYSFLDYSRLENINPEECISNLHHTASDLQPPGFDISVDYCLAQPLNTKCQIGVSPILLLLVTICVVVKTITAIVVTTFLSYTRQTPLVTPGDAIESFIMKPDIITIGYCTMDHRGLRKAFKSNSSPPSPGPLPWRGVRKRWAFAITRSGWAESYLIILIGIGVCIGFFIMIVSTFNVITGGGFFQSSDSPIIPLNLPFINAVLLANSPQLLVTFCYFTYNNILTHLQSALEWTKFGHEYTPLRVTEPKGEQLSTYRLQIPYRYSLPLIVASIFLHWILANTMYVLISTGGYYVSPGQNDPSLPPDAAILVGYSPTALLTLIIVGIVLVLIPPIWSWFKRLPPNIVIPGCNSLAISAACHVSTLSYNIKCADTSNNNSTLSAPTSSRLRNLGRRHHVGNGAYELLGGSDRESSENDLERERSDGNRSKMLAQRKLRWGVLRMPLEWYTQHGYDPDSVGHLGFGTLEDGVAAPLWGHLYA
ncbi:hypothetical protein F4803DRAFT_560452 [Xylaria telfairii]|nr:hypothetical protein F4803DRAFT_560452 [Xylaria telfairii]